MKDLTVLVNSCDKYSDAWEPFFKLMHDYWTECDYDIVLVTENKDYSCKYFNVKTIKCGQKPWGKRLKMALNSIDTKYVLYFLEDFFLLEKVNHDSFLEALNTIRNDGTIGYLGLKNNSKYIWKDGSDCHSKEKFINRDDLKIYHRVNNMTAIWDREWFIKLIRVHETPWEFDNMASYRSHRYPYKVLLINNEVLPRCFTYEIDFEFGYGISQKWLPNNKKLFKEHGIIVNFSNLGFLDQGSIERRLKGQKPKAKKINPLRSYLSDLKKTLRRLRSKYSPI